MENPKNERMIIVEAIISLKEKGLIKEDDIKKVMNGEINLCDLSQIATKAYYAKELWKLDKEFNASFVQNNPPYEFGQLFNFLNMV